MQPVKLALIGAGQRGQFAYAPYALNNPHKVRFVAVVEPDEERRLLFQKEHDLQDNQVFKNSDDFFANKVEADAVLVCNQDRQHYEAAIKVLESGYHLLLEKPISPSASECVSLLDCALKNKRIMVVCHVLRYTKFFKKLKEILDSGKIGKLVTMTHNENIGYFHQAHSFVRGNWGNTEKSAPIILAKSCHDMDIMMWLAGSECESLSSIGSLSHFKESEAPKGAAKRCIENCPVEQSCPYSALKIYLNSGNTGWPTSVLVNNVTKENVVQALKEGPYGRCVYHCDNDVADNQILNIQFANGVTASFSMCAFTHEVSRTIKLMGTHGEIRGHMEKNEIEIIDFSTLEVEVIKLPPSTTGHSGGDEGIMHDFVELIAKGELPEGKQSPVASVQSHLMAFAAEKSRLENKVINIKEFEASVKAKG